MQAAAAIPAATPIKKKSRTYIIKSFFTWQKDTPSECHSIECYIASCEKNAKVISNDVIVLRDNVLSLKGWYMVDGWSPQHDAEINGYVDVRTGKHYPNSYAFCKDII